MGFFQNIPSAPTDPTRSGPNSNTPEAHVMTSPRPLATVLGAMWVATVLLGGCGSGAENPGHQGTAISARPVPKGSHPSGQSIEITIHHGRVTPDGKRVQVDVGTPLTLVIDADAPGELHVHGSPEQQVEYPAGRSRAQLTLDQPGLVDVESHTLDRLVVQLEVR